MADDGNVVDSKGRSRHGKGKKVFFMKGQKIVVFVRSRYPISNSFADQTRRKPSLIPRVNYSVPVQLLAGGVHLPRPRDQLPGKTNPSPADDTHRQPAASLETSVRPL